MPSEKLKSIMECHTKLEKKVADLEEALELVMACKPNLIINTDHPEQMVKEVLDYLGVNAHTQEDWEAYWEGRLDGESTG